MSSIDSDSDNASGHENDRLESEDELDRNESHGGEDLSDDDRPGRFYGPDSSWRFYTQGERALAASLDQAEHNDLSIHLYNAHAWKQHHRDEQRIVESKPWHSKQRWIQPDEKGKLPFLPPPTWTAWPLRPEEVPRSTEQWGVPTTNAEDEADTIHAERPWKPSLHLREDIQATFLRLAKDRFHGRDWADEESSKEDVKAESLSRSRRSSFVKPENDSDDPLDDLSRLEEKLQRGSSPVPSASTDHYIPMVLDDDDAARRVLQPLVGHILGKFDHLLIALHKSRQGHCKERSGPGSRSRGSRSRSKSRPRPPGGATAAKKRKRVASDAYKQVEDDEGVEVEDISDDVVGEDDVSRRISSKYTLGTRDWSEVLGIAALAGFDQAVIDRTARRCATLFREGMSVRTMPEVTASVAHDQTTDYMPDMISPIESESDGSEESSDEGDQIYSCPHPTCERHVRPFEHQWRLNEHLKRKHKYSDAHLTSVDVKPSSSSREASADTSVHDEDPPAPGEVGEAERMVDASTVRRNSFLQPIAVCIGRSRGQRARKARSGSARMRTGSTSSTGTSSDSA